MVAEMQATKKPTRDYSSYSTTPWSLWETMYARRSHRKYVSTELSGEFVASLEDTVRLALRARGAPEGSLIAVTELKLVEVVKKRSYKGLANKINIWLARSPVAGFLVIALPRDDVRGDRPQDLPKATMAAEDTVLWIAEEGVGTCWLGGVNDKEICATLGLGADMSVPAMISVGRPKAAVRSGGYDRILYLGLSRRRKPLSAIAFIENETKPYNIQDIPTEPFSASTEQKVRPLLEKIIGGSPGGSEAPLELVIDACLESARIAPNAGNFQKWQFIAVKESENLRTLQSACGSTGAWRVAIVSAGYTKKIEAGLLDKPFWMIDSPIALSHMSLMAASMGCAFDVCTDDIDESAINKLVGLPQSLRTVGVLGLR
jgi:nitroreductase